MRIYSANVAPIIDDEGKELYVIEAKLKAFNDFIEDMINTLKHPELIGRLSRLISESPDLRGVLDALRLLNDLIVICLRRVFTIPLIPPSKDGKPTYVFAPADLLYSYVIARDLGLLEEEEISKFLGTPLTDLSYEVISRFVEAVVRGLSSEVIKQVFSIRSPHEVYERFRDLVMSIPADTRPGLNISKLIPHILLTSAIASIRYLSIESRGGGKKRELTHKLHLEVLRLASLLHDIGKPKAWITGKLVKHAEKSAEIVDTLLRDVLEKAVVESKLSDDIKSKILSLARSLRSAIVEIVRKHHVPQDVSPRYSLGGAELHTGLLAKILSYADRAASTTERLLDEVVNVLLESKVVKSKGINRNELVNALRKTGPEAWSFWERFSDDEIKELSEEVARRLGSEALRLTEAREIIEDVKVLMLDVRGIQSFIRRESLRSVAAASTLIDLVILYAVPKTLMKEFDLPLEAFIFMGGGNLIALVPERVSENDVGKALSKMNLGVKVGFSIALTPFTVPWIVTQGKLTSRLAAAKITIESVDADVEDILLGYEVLCESCRRKPAIEIKDELESREKLCEECYRLFRFGRSMYIKYKLELLNTLGYTSVSKYLKDKDGIRKLYMYLMGWLSGAEDYVRESKYLSVVKIDGNAIGSYMAYSLTPAEAFLRSIRVDLSTKLGIYTLLESMLKRVQEQRESILEELIIRTFSGILYAGGDDLLALVPANMSIPLCLSVAYWFWRLTGTRTISVGIACGKPKHNVWLLIDTATRLLSKSKEKFRKEFSEEIKRSDALMYLYFELGTQQLLPSVVDDVIKVYGGTGLYREPYVLSFRALSRGDSLELPFKLLGVIDSGYDLRRKTDLEKALDRLLAMIKDPSIIERIRGLMAELLTSLRPLLGTTPLSNVWASLAAKLSWRIARIEAGLAGDKIEASVLKELANLMLNEYKVYGKHILPPIRDLLVLMNILLNRG